MERKKKVVSICVGDGERESFFTYQRLSFKKRGRIDYVAKRL